jgi:zinc and cadmium transporter
MVLTWILGFSFLGSVGGVAAAAGFLAFPDRMRRTLVPSFVSFAVGALMGTAFLGLLPTALRLATPGTVFGAMLGGMVLFFILEKLVLWRHCHDEHCEGHRPAGPLLLLGDGLHNFVDGALIAGAFLTDVPLGIATTVAVVAHEVPQEVGDFAILLDSGYSRRRALAFNLFSGLATLVGALLAYFALAAAREAVPYLLSVSAASFVYVATADLIPNLHRRSNDLAAGFSQLLLILAGIGSILVFRLGD